jgi:hypothetical protein
MVDRLGRDRVVLLLLFVLGVAFFVHNANLQLASDDVAWLRGEAPTVFDQYRKIPRLFFVSLHAMFGSSAVAALVMIVGFHVLNSLLVYHLGKSLLEDRLAALIAVAAFAINPLTLNTLTWISCFSYVQGTTLALLTLLAFHRTQQGDTRLRLFWSAFTLLCFGLGLFCSHETLFLPMILPVLGWLQGDVKRGAVLAVVGTAFALGVNAFVYDFGRYGVEASRLLSFDFALAYASSGVSSGVALALAYPLSFFVKPLEFLRFCFSEPLRWGMTVTVVASGVLFCRNNRAWRLALALLLAFLVLIAPYVIRLYLTPDTVGYHISYVLSGRVFYLPFTVIALVLGWLVSELYSRIGEWRQAWLLFLPAIAAYGHALWLYDKTDFMGLNVVREFPTGMPPRWNPYASQQPLWFLFGGLVLTMVVMIRSQVTARRPGDIL